jgi:hypothetical protein
VPSAQAQGEDEVVPACRSRKQSILLGFDEGRWAESWHKPIEQPVGEKIKGIDERSRLVDEHLHEMSAQLNKSPINKQT